ncbi:hypothetical protein Moror_8687 [Moniliophthora roreri MCA 2997]|uniref:Uncharacterized protein n=1 Tax=Moniliophthora roreri (strain MCA 2997) TaxID=1381753 RepID=V2YCY8_MONRO|nr:hypothetical protein Moror_8687 [Moniliophthora roreri MCA 2997]
MSLFVLGPRLGVEKNGVFGKLAQLVVSISNSLFQLGLRVISAVGMFGYCILSNIDQIVERIRLWKTSEEKEHLVPPGHQLSRTRDPSDDLEEYRFTLYDTAVVSQPDREGQKGWFGHSTN